jgi:hypothetical protein
MVRTNNGNNSNNSTANNNGNGNSNTGQGSQWGSGAIVLWSILGVVMLILAVLGVIDVCRAIELSPGQKTIWVVFIAIFPGFGLISWVIYRSLYRNSQQQLQAPDRRTRRAAFSPEYRLE